MHGIENVASKHKNGHTEEYFGQKYVGSNAMRTVLEASIVAQHNAFYIIRKKSFLNQQSFALQISIKHIHIAIQ